MRIQPFNINTLKSILLIVFVFFVINQIPCSDNVFYSVTIRFAVLFLLYFPLLFVLHISEDINKILMDLWKKLNAS